MTRTSTRVAFGLYAMTIKQDGYFEGFNIQPFSNVADLKTGNVTSKPYITYEPDYWLLDGTYKFKPEDNNMVHAGLWSQYQSDANGDFDGVNPPMLSIEFGSIHSSDGLVLRFASASNDFATDILVEYLDENADLIRSDHYTPDAWEFQTHQSVENFKLIVITFNKTNKPSRYLRVTGIDFGTLIYFEEDTIKSASVVQKVNPLSVELPIGSLDLSILSSDTSFDITDPTNEYAALRNRQPLDVYETVNGATIYIGQFYLDTWESKSQNIISFEAVDRIGVLDTLTYMGGIWMDSDGVIAGELIDEILAAANAPYELDPDLYEISVIGWIPICSYREALQQICFAIGAYVTTARSGTLQIKKTVLATELASFEFAISKAQKSLSQSLTLKTRVTGVDLTAHRYIASTESIELFNGVLVAGTHTITFSSPAHNLSITGATLIEVGANYVIVSVSVVGTVVISGQRYTDTTQIVSKNDLTIDAFTPKNVLSITNATLVNAGNASEILERVYNYYQQRYLHKVKLFVPNVIPGSSAEVEMYNDKKLGGIVEKMEVDLTGGFTSKTEITGVIL